MSSFDRAAGFYDATRGLPDDVRERGGALAAEDLQGRWDMSRDRRQAQAGSHFPLHQRGVRLVGADIAPAMLQRLVDNAGGQRPFPLLLADITQLAVQDSCVGAVLPPVTSCTC